MLTHSSRPMECERTVLRNSQEREEDFSSSSFAKCRDSWTVPLIFQPHWRRCLQICPRLWTFSSDCCP
ncbi:hypothetical protein PDJAM_G00070220 [Pangasius djambal]|uniref:Uncharacterized protein n=1 Tax=Pangasius djambal TaxID=1691987 RepID=A0ACC5Z0M1_9TELE|nr:hypothetical protein [Pangasius djambal]